ncbi:MAG TPA: hypothetical protein G4O04_00110 [Anaerolineae bacterium]|nr:hypothetical protein [Anaerolineae bacterium]HID84157.1 hypothetical protein [Anaerolineales bacterium]HIQ09532.1 hypothetical protein [Anaerolineaceae bacterium]
MRRPNPWDRLTQPWQPIEVRCRSEYRYAQEPQALRWESQWVTVQRIVARWQTPEGPAFRLLTADGRLYDIRHREDAAQWEGRQL